MSGVGITTAVPLSRKVRTSRPDSGIGLSHFLILKPYVLPFLLDSGTTVGITTDTCYICPLQSKAISGVGITTAVPLSSELGKSRPDSGIGLSYFL